jgi:molecular chaperone GrpE (heat shock protein)
MLLHVRNLCKDASGQRQRLALSAVISTMMMGAPSHPYPLPRPAASLVHHEAQFRLATGLLSSLPSDGLAIDSTDQEGEDKSDQHPDDNGEQESKESYAWRYANLDREPWEAEEKEDEDDDEYEYDATFENYFDQKPGHYIHDMIDRIDHLKEAVRKAANDVRARDITIAKLTKDVRDREATIANLAETILDAGRISQISATVQESGAAGAKEITESLGKIEAALAQSLERDGLMSVGFVGDVFDPAVHKAVVDDSGATGSSKLPSGTVGLVSKVGFKMKNQVIRRAKVAVIGNPSTLE